MPGSYDRELHLGNRGNFCDKKRWKRDSPEIRPLRWGLAFASLGELVCTSSTHYMNAEPRTVVDKKRQFVVEDVKTQLADLKDKLARVEESLAAFKG